MSIINNILNDEYGLVYDNTSGRIYQKEVTWECDTSNESKTNANTMPDWFKQWSETQRLNTGSVPKWFLDWMNKANISLPQMQLPTGVIGNMVTGSANPNEIPPWFRDWLNTQGRQPSYSYPQPLSYQTLPPSTLTSTSNQTTTLPSTSPLTSYPYPYPYPYQTQPSYPYPYQTQPSYPYSYPYPYQTQPPPQGSTYSTPIIMTPTIVANTPPPLIK